MVKLIQQTVPPERWDLVTEIQKQHEDAFLAIASGRYEWIERMMRAAVQRPRAGQIGMTDRLDRWATHPVAGLGILGIILGLVFWLTFTIGSPIQNWLGAELVKPLGSIIGTWLTSAPFWIRGLVVDGIIGGVGSVLTFIPIIMIFFAAFGLLEDIGYMARAAYVMDNFMHWMGLHGKSFLPLFLGFGCNVPAVMGTRVIESRKARLLTIILAPLVPCTARMAVLAFLTPAFFGNRAVLVSWGLIIFSLFLLIIAGVILNRLLFKGERSAFVMELPLYHIPNWRTTALMVWQRSLSFVKKAGTIILGISVAVWVLSVLPNGNIETSFLAMVGKFLEPVGRWMGTGLEIDSRIAHQLYGKRKFDRNVGSVIRQCSWNRISSDVIHHLFGSDRVGIPHSFTAFHPVCCHRCGHSPGNWFVEMDRFEYWHDVVIIDRDCVRCLCNCKVNGVIKCWNKCWNSFKKAVLYLPLNLAIR